MDALSFRDWAWLPAHIVDLIVVKFDRFSDYVRFSWVCPQWRHVALEANIDHKVKLEALKASRKKLPLLMFRIDENNHQLRSLYSVSDGKTYTIKLPLPYSGRFVGSSHGWLFCIEDETEIPTLMNPYNNDCIRLPEVFNPRMLLRHMDYYLKKMILLSDPNTSPESFVVVLLYHHDTRLAFFTSGDNSWKFMDCDICDMIPYKGKLYATDGERTLYHVNLRSRTIKTVIPQTDCGNVNYSYLVESQDGGLLMVERTWLAHPDDLVDEQGFDEGQGFDHGQGFDNGQGFDEGQGFEGLGFDDGQGIDEGQGFDYGQGFDDASSIAYDDESDGHTHVSLSKTFKFKILKMTNPVEKGSAARWVEMKDIGEQALFVGDNHSISVSTTDFPGCKPNSIYYTSQQHFNFDGYDYLDEDSGIYCLDDESISCHHVLGFPDKYMQPPIWFLTNP